MRYFFHRHLPQTARILLVESGSRHLIEGILPNLRQNFGENVEIDLVTCYPGSPRGLDGQIFRIADYNGASGRDRLLADLAPRGYQLAGMICAAEPIMTKWKWWLVFRVKAKFFILNENGDYFWFDWQHRHLIAKFAAYRAGLTGSAAVPALARFLMFPLTLTYLILYAGAVHLRRRLRA
ncbi:MAG TPA: hypothetical protein VGN17_00245 [Bryobacteraceae bacterium]